jgi:hypothetical protein
MPILLVPSARCSNFHQRKVKEFRCYFQDPPVDFVPEFYFPKVHIAMRYRKYGRQGLQVA